MKTVYILMGVIGAGKSTFARSLSAETGAVVIANDEIRKEFIFKGEIPEKYDSKYNQIVFAEMENRAEKCLNEGKNIIIDSTNVPASAREPFLMLAKKYRAKSHGILLLLDDEECVRRVYDRQNSDKNSHFIENPKQALEIYKERLLKGLPALEEGFTQIDTYKNGELEKSEKRVMIASTNAGKIAIYGDILNSLSIQYCSLSDIDMGFDVDENGSDEIENAKIKAMAYHKVSGLPVIANDSGLYIHNLPPECQPGLFVRRYGSRVLTDEEMLCEYIKLLKQYGGDSDAHYNVGLAIIDKDGNLFAKMFQPSLYLTTTPSKIMQKGCPLNSISFDKKVGKYLSEMTPHEKNLSEGDAMKMQEEFIYFSFKEK